MDRRKASAVDVDSILRELAIGKFQYVCFIFIGLSIFINCLSGATFIFTARDPLYRCFIPGCDSPVPKYFQSWLQNALPFHNSDPSKCEMFVKINESSVTCHREEFLYDRTESCQEWVYGEEKTIIEDFLMPCEDWKRTLVGTVNSVGQFICLSFSGFISDTIGRRNVAVYATIISGLFGIAQSFTVDYWSFLFFEFLVTVIGSGAFSASFILGIETMVPEKRVLGSTIMNLACGVATISLGIMAWLFPNWRNLLRVTYLPSIFMIFSLWLFPESVRWLFAKKRYYEGTQIFKKAAIMNSVKFSEKVTNHLEYLTLEKHEIIENNENSAPSSISEKEKLPFKAVLRSRVLLIRLIVCTFCWITNAFVYYGFLLNAVSIFGSDSNPYLNFSLAALVELPAQGLVVLLLDRLGRRKCLSGSLLGSALSCFLFIAIPSDWKILNLLIYLCGKLLITLSFNVIYIYTTELFPTSLRHSTLSCCSMMGRIGSMLAPQTPLLVRYYSQLPMLLFGIMGAISGISVLIFPETFNLTLPDTVEEAENIGKSEPLTEQKSPNEIIVEKIETASA